MLIEPREAEPGALWRWTRQAWGLIGRAFGFWAGLALLMCLWMFFGQRLPLVDGILALAAFFASILIAAEVDRPQRATLGEVLAMLRRHAFDVFVFSGIIAVAGAVIWMLLLSRPDVPWWSPLYSERNIVTELSPNWLAAMRQIFVYAAVALGLLYFCLNIPGLTSFFQFPCTTLLGMTFRDAYKLSAIGQIKNLPLVMMIGLMFITLPVLWMLVLPPLVALLYCFLGALTYVSFREIFLGIGSNREAEAAAPAAERLSSRA